MNISWTFPLFPFAREVKVNNADNIIEDSERVLRELFSKLELTDDEKAFVNSASRRLANFAFELLVEVPQEKLNHMRGIITSLAIAMSNGKGELK